METLATNYKDHHDPRNEDCLHNVNPENPCQCKRTLNRKPYKVCRVTDRSVGHGIRERFACEIHPDGRLVIREEGRRLRVSTTLGTVYEQCLQRDARCAIFEKNKARGKARAERRAARKLLRRKVVA